uniref:Protein kinase domain-containing protein n=1 Tax=Pinguiococcus pyrenoidosus TaxID=172671 RepID=A0A7R9U340_9STRA
MASTTQKKRAPPPFRPPPAPLGGRPSPPPGPPPLGGQRNSTTASPPILRPGDSDAKPPTPLERVSETQRDASPRSRAARPAPPSDSPPVPPELLSKQLPGRTRLQPENELRWSQPSMYGTTKAEGRGNGVRKAPPPPPPPVQPGLQEEPVGIYPGVSPVNTAGHAFNEPRANASSPSRVPWRDDRESSVSGSRPTVTSPGAGFRKPPLPVSARRHTMSDKVRGMVTGFGSALTRSLLGGRDRGSSTDSTGSIGTMSAPDIQITGPFNVQHHHHVTVDKHTKKLTGLPAEWQVLIDAFFSEEEQSSCGENIEQAVRFHMGASSSTLASHVSHVMPRKSFVEEEIKRVEFRRDRLEDEYKPVRRIGKGSSGEVFEVEHMVTGKRYALKRCTVSDSEDVTLEDLKQEIALQCQSEHENIVAFHEVFINEAEDTISMVLDLCKYGGLNRVIAKGGWEFPEEHIAYVCRAVGF